MADGREPISTSPHSASHLRVVLDRLRRQGTTTNSVILPGHWTATGTITEGDLLYVVSAGVLGLADASALSTSYVIGVAKESATAGATLVVQTAGVMVYSGWTLTAGAMHYLSTTPGEPTATAPQTPGQTVTNVGIAVNTTELVLLLTPPLLL